MTDAILMFTFSPIQSFISEARRAGDLHTASQILVRLARAVGTAIGEERLVYPTTLAQDTPNRLVAKVPWEQVDDLRKAAQTELVREWENLASPAKVYLASHGPQLDSTWQEIWDRQKDHHWECYWVAGKLTSADNYRSVYERCIRALDAVKHTRAFAQCKEDGEKDTLSGARSALRVQGMRARQYWSAVSQSGVHAAALRPNGRERLDTLGAVKRFGGIAGAFPSVSSVAARTFLDRSLEKSESRGQLDSYRKTVEDLLGTRLYKVPTLHPDWPYDGDLLFVESLTNKELEESYGTQVTDGQLKRAEATLKDLYKAVDLRPCPYYAIVLLDGDNMGKRVAHCQTEEEHRDLSRSLSSFASSVPGIAIANLGTPIYAGGDDILALAPLAKAMPLAQALASAFHDGTQGTASAGVTVAHHRYPLDAALRAARTAEREAKTVDGKAAAAVHVIKRSGERVEVRSRWEDMEQPFQRLVEWFQAKALSSGFAYDVALSAYALEPGEMLRSELKRLIVRHRDSKQADSLEPRTLAEQLDSWASHLPGLPGEQATALASWVLVARFVAQGGGE